ncbi:MAG: enoyl-CoA hydratase/isomerase family protein [Phycisphaerae bacterium]|nr:enoyl-CoA hydratase/isomerase family protein [Phycisphaerae bacterium]
MSEILKTIRHARAVQLVMRRPECRNALSRELVDALTTALRAAADDSVVRGIVIRGTPPAFCSGLDLREVNDSAGAAYDTSPLLTLYETIENARVPVIAAVGGAALAGGAGIVTACDLAVFGESATIGYPGIKHGLVAPIVMVYLRRLVGERFARQLLLSGAAIDAEHALRVGLCNAVVRDDEITNWALGEIDQLAEAPADAVARTKILLNRMRDEVGGSAAEEVRRLSAEVDLTDASRANLSAFLDR